MVDTETDSKFEDWIAFVFDHPADGPQWYLGDYDKPDSYADSPLMVRFLTRLFNESGTVLASYSDAQVGQGLWYAASNGLSDYMLSLADSGVPVAQRVACVESFGSLYRDCFAHRCTPHLSHIHEAGAGPLNGACYMWWDMLPFVGDPLQPSRSSFDGACLRQMESALALESIACQESALHGLGHWARAYPGRVEAIVDRFLGNQPSLRQELRDYAFAARTGCVQ